MAEKISSIGVCVASTRSADRPPSMENSARAAVQHRKMHAQATRRPEANNVIALLRRIEAPLAPAAGWRSIFPRRARTRAKGVARLKRLLLNRPDVDVHTLSCGSLGWAPVVREGESDILWDAVAHRGRQVSDASQEHRHVRVSLHIEEKEFLMEAAPAIYFEPVVMFDWLVRATPSDSKLAQCISRAWRFLALRKLQVEPAWPASRKTKILEA